MLGALSLGSRSRIYGKLSHTPRMLPFSTTNGLSSDNVSDIWDPSSPPPLDDDVDEDDGEDGGGDNDEAEDEEEDEEDDEDPAILEWKETRNPVHPRVPEFEDIEYAQRDMARLAHKFKKAGLQVIVKMVSIELTPEKPELPAGEWHVSKERSRSRLLPTRLRPSRLDVYTNMANVRLMDR